jgi:N6-L-threonylcarbamoyladenine synthase
MIILGIETSCDETAVCIVEADGGVDAPLFSVRGNALFSQVALHAQYGGVYPNLARRKHGNNLTPLLNQALNQANLPHSPLPISTEQWQTAKKLLLKEEGLFSELEEFIKHTPRPNIDMIAVTTGPGLEPALWVGITFAQALSVLWNISIMPTNHMEGHIISVLAQSHIDTHVTFPALALLISGGHTELVNVKNWGSYTTIGASRDDAVGEAFDKVARMLSLPYPGGPEVSKQADLARNNNLPESVIFPRPMIHSDNYDFSFSGLKTSVLYHLKEHPIQTSEDISIICRAFEDAVVDVLVSKTSRALKDTGAQTLVIAGGVIANTRIREAFITMISSNFSHVTLRIPTKELSTDNAVMIAGAGYIESIIHHERIGNISLLKASGNLKKTWL